ncbi:MAG TPA: hypothetical protein VFV94_10195, partial [Polyangiaceae bacterium]|nr:hypothetical protein [Polyangiaceae bacterium]
MILGRKRPAAETLALGLCFAASVAGCKEGDPEKCTQAQAVVGQSLDAENFDAARQWREYAYKQCEDRGPLTALDLKITERESAVQQRN